MYERYHFFGPLCIYYEHRRNVHHSHWYQLSTVLAFVRPINCITLLLLLLLILYTEKVYYNTVRFTTFMAYLLYLISVVYNFLHACVEIYLFKHI